MFSLTQNLFSDLIYTCFQNDLAPVILCIGTDRIIGDSLGPMVGTFLNRSSCKHRFFIYGSLEHTVHALNLSMVYADIKKKHPGHPVIAVDASLGSKEQIGSIHIRTGHLRPGAGVNKELPHVGDIAITGITNAMSSHPYLDLQTARLSVVSKMADAITNCILLSAGYS